MKAGLVGGGNFDASAPIVVLTLSRNLIQHGVVGVARSAGRLGIPVHWLHNQATPLAAASRYMTGHYCVQDDGSLGAADWIDRLLHIGDALGGRPVLIPTDDAGAILVDDHAGVLQRQFRFPSRPAGLARSLSNKKELHRLCSRVGIRSPDAVFPATHDDALAYASAGSFPVVMKRIEESPRADDTLKSVLIVETPEKLKRVVEGLDESTVRNIMLQEYIPGGIGSVCMYNAYFDGRSQCLAAFTGEKLREYPAYTGMASLGICKRNALIEEKTEKFLTQVGYSGIVDLGYRYDAHKSEYVILDVNPRIGATFRLFVDANGLDVLRAAYLDLTGQTVTASPATLAGRKWAVEHHDLVSSYRYLRDRRLTLRQWISSLRGIQETAWFARDDLRPAIRLFAHLAVRAVLAPRDYGARLLRIDALATRRSDHEAQKP